MSAARQRLCHSPQAYKTVKKASKAKMIRRGVKEVPGPSRHHAQPRRSPARPRAQVVKALKKDTKGLCIIAGNISPIDVIAHVPILCEEKGVSYVYVPSKEDLGEASQTKRPTSIVLVTCADEFKESYDELASELAAIAPSWR